jgi:hypothetical protein
MAEESDGLEDGIRVLDRAAQAAAAAPLPVPAPIIISQDSDEEGDDADGGATPALFVAAETAGGWTGGNHSTFLNAEGGASSPFAPAPSGGGLLWDTIKNEGLWQGAKFLGRRMLGRTAATAATEVAAEAAAVAGGTTLAGVATAAATGLAIGGAVIVTPLALIVNKKFDEADAAIKAEAQPKRFFGNDVSVDHYKHIPSMMVEVSRNMRDESLSTPIARTANGGFDDIQRRKLDMRDSRNVMEFQRALDAEIEAQCQRLQSLDPSWAPEWATGMIDSVGTLFGRQDAPNQKRDAMHRFLTAMAAKEELASYISELKGNSPTLTSEKAFYGVGSVPPAPQTKTIPDQPSHRAGTDYSKLTNAEVPMLALRGTTYVLGDSFSNIFAMGTTGVVQKHGVDGSHIRNDKLGKMGVLEQTDDLIKNAYFKDGDKIVMATGRNDFYAAGSDDYTRDMRRVAANLAFAARQGATVVWVPPPPAGDKDPAGAAKMLAAQKTIYDEARKQLSPEQQQRFRFAEITEDIKRRKSDGYHPDSPKQFVAAISRASGVDLVTSAVAAAPKPGRGQKSHQDVPASQRAAYAMEYFMRRGRTPAQAAGIVANLIGESGVNLDIRAKGDFDEKKRVYTAHGIAQWRHERVANFARVNGGKQIQDSTFEEQLNFVEWELKNTHNGAGRELNKSRTPQEAATAITYHYERPFDKAGDAIKRGVVAAQLYAQFSGDPNTRLAAAGTHHRPPARGVLPQGGGVQVADSNPHPSPGGGRRRGGLEHEVGIGGV